MKKTVTSVFLLLLFNSFSQSSIDSLLTQRQEMIVLGLNTAEIDQNLFSQNVRVKANIQSLTSTEFVFFPIFLITQSKAQVYSNRLSSTYSNLQSVQYLDDSNKIKITFNNAPTPAELDQIVAHFSFVGHEIN